jgi:hypothetical protein
MPGLETAEPATPRDRTNTTPGPNADNPNADNPNADNPNADNPNADNPNDGPFDHISTEVYWATDTATYRRGREGARAARVRQGDATGALDDGAASAHSRQQGAEGVGRDDSGAYEGTAAEQAGVVSPSNREGPRQWPDMARRLRRM